MKLNKVRASQFYSHNYSAAETYLFVVYWCVICNCVMIYGSDLQTILHRRPASKASQVRKHPVKYHLKVGKDDAGNNYYPIPDISGLGLLKKNKETQYDISLR